MACRETCGFGSPTRVRVASLVANATLQIYDHHLGRFSFRANVTRGCNGLGMSDSGSPRRADVERPRKLLGDVFALRTFIDQIFPGN